MVKHFILTTLCYIRKNGKILMLYRNKKENDLNQGKWVGVGGKFEEGETPDQCLIREVFEETGLTLTRFHLHGVVTFVSDTWDNEYMFLYTGTEYSGELSPDCQEGILRWIDEDKILSLPMWEGDHYFLKPLLDGQDHIDLKVRYQGDRLVSVSSGLSEAPQKIHL